MARTVATCPRCADEAYIVEGMCAVCGMEVLMEEPQFGRFPEDQWPLTELRGLNREMNRLDREATDGTEDDEAQV